MEFVSAGSLDVDTLLQRGLVLERLEESAHGDEMLLVDDDHTPTTFDMSLDEMLMMSSPDDVGTVADAQLNQSITDGTIQSLMDCGPNDQNKEFDSNWQTLCLTQHHTWCKSKKLWFGTQ